MRVSFGRSEFDWVLEKYCAFVVEIAKISQHTWNSAKTTFVLNYGSLLVQSFYIGPQSIPIEPQSLPIGPQCLPNGPQPIPLDPGSVATWIRSPQSLTPRLGFLIMGGGCMLSVLKILSIACFFRRGFEHVQYSDTLVQYSDALAQYSDTLVR